MIQFELGWVDYDGQKAIVLREYPDSNDIDTLFDLFVLSDPPLVVNGVSGVYLFGEVEEEEEE